MTAEEVAYNAMAYYLASENLTGERFKNYFRDEEYNIDDINFYIPKCKADIEQVFLVLKNHKNLYEIVELVRSKSASS